MTYEQKFAALNALSGAVLKMRKPGDWYVAQSIEVKNGSILAARYGNGETPELAIEDHWRQLTDIGPEECLVTNAMSENRRQFRWNGYMWADA